MRDPKTGKFMKRVKQALSSSQPSTLEHLFVEKTKEKSMDMKEEVSGTLTRMTPSSVSVDVVPTKQQHARQSARRSYTMSATITVVGNLTADPELRQTNSGKSVVNFALAYTPRKPDGTDGNTSFYNIVAWEYLADNFAASFKKGDRLIVVGRVTQDKWTDKESEKIMSRLVITADEIGGTCRFHTVEMSKVAKVGSSVQEPAEAAEESEDIFA